MAKTSKSAKSERQKLIDQAMNKQRGADKRRGFAIVGVCILISALIVGAAAYRPIKSAIDERQYKSVALSSIGAPASACQDVITKKASGVSNHVDQDVTVDYDTAPPAYGAHWNIAGLAPAPFTDKFYDSTDRPELEALVHNLEHGYTILWYDKTIADDAGEMSKIRSIARKFDISDDNFRLKFIAAPWESSDENGASFPDDQHVAFTHWSGDSTKSVGVWQYCSKTSGAALETFMDDYPYTDSPESGAM
ncbi:hypothetical protein BH11ACT8_BH11ACT8_34300 [soil metagenome]